MVAFEPHVESPVGRVTVEDVLQDARRVGECLTLKLFLQQYTLALRHLIFDLTDRARECRHETHPSPEAAHRFCRVFDEAIRHFLRATSHPRTSSAKSLRAEIFDRIDQFVDSLGDDLPRRAPPLSAGAGSNAVYNWKMRLNSAARKANKLARDLQKQLDRLEQKQVEKATLYKSMDAAVQTLVKVF